MKKQFTIPIIFVVVVLSIVGYVVWLGDNDTANNLPEKIGGDREEHGCLSAAGYSFDTEVGACLRSFELTSDIKRAARLAVEKVGGSYALTVVSFNSYEEIGAYDITFERGLERQPETVHLKNWQVVSVSK